MRTCRYVNQVGIRCGQPEGHKDSHSNGLLTTPRDEWKLPEVPVFSIKFSDPFACALIRQWIIMAASYRGKIVDEKTGRQEIVPIEKVSGAVGRLEECRQWQKENGTKVPD